MSSNNIFENIIFGIFSFDFCTISDEPSPVENLGQVLFGERIRPSPYKVCLYQNSLLFQLKFSIIVRFS